MNHYKRYPITAENFQHIGPMLAAQTIPLVQRIDPERVERYLADAARRRHPGRSVRVQRMDGDPSGHVAAAG